VAQRLVVVQQAPRRHVRPAGVLLFEVRERHAVMMTVLLAGTRAVNGAGLVVKL
jgi:hypothetical protein